jgi:hypothetical protein
MPFSSNSGKHLIDRAVQRIAGAHNNNLRVLDVGVGSGTYYDRYGKGLLPKPRTEWIGIEIWRPYIEKYSLPDKYDKLYEKDAVLVARDFIGIYTPQKIDICFVGDVAEHMEKEKAVYLLNTLSDSCKYLVMSIPLGHYPQDEYDGNPFEKHVKDDWTHEEVISTFGNLIVEYGIENEIGVYFMASDIYQRELLNLLRPKIAVYGICKNEEQFAARFAASVVYADHSVICDTGSKDATKEILLKGGVTNVYQTHVAPWRFDDARNNALMLVPQDVDLCISLDLDEYLQDGWYDILYGEIQMHYRTRGRLYDKYNCRFQTIWDWRTIASDAESTNKSSHWHERIHTRHNWRWKLPVHEILVYTGTDHAEQWAWLGGFLMTQKPDMKEGKHTYLPLLEQSLKEDPKVWKSWFFYADELVKAGRRMDGIEALASAIDIPGCDTSYIHLILGGYWKPIDIMEAQMHYRKACSLAPSSRERWVTLALFFKEVGPANQATYAIEKAKQCTTQSSGYDNNPWCWGPGFDALYEELRDKSI